MHIPSLVMDPDNGTLEEPKAPITWLGNTRNYAIFQPLFTWIYLHTIDTVAVLSGYIVNLVNQLCLPFHHK